jgi:hypothetical protein
MRRTTMPRALAATLAMLLAVPGGAMAQGEYSLAELEQRCEDNASSEAARDTCLAVLYLILAPEADKEPPDPPQDPASADIPGTGMFIVGVDIAPGTYRTPGPVSSSCYYARLSGFSGTLDDIVANGNAAGPAVIAILPSDAAFETSRCQPWAKVDLPVDSATPRPRPSATPRATADPAAAAGPSEQPKARFYRVKAGDSLTSIAARFDVSPRHLGCINGIRNKNILVLGARLEIPPEGFSCPRGWRNATPDP